MTSQVKAQAEISILPKDHATLEVTEGQQIERRTPSASQTESKEEKQPVTGVYLLRTKLTFLSLLVGAVIFFDTSTRKSTRKIHLPLQRDAPSTTN